MTKSSALISKNLTEQRTHEYLYTSMVSHRGTPVSFAMTTGGYIYYSVLDMSNTEQNANTSNKIDEDGDQENDKNYWSSINYGTDGEVGSRLNFPTEIMQVGYSVVPNFQMDKYDSENNKIIHSYDENGKPLDADGKELSDKTIEGKTDHFNSSTARLGAKAPFQVLSDGKYIYLFRQSIAAEDANNESPAIVNNTLLVDRFILSGTILKLSREIRYQRSRHKTEPKSRKDTLAAVDMEGYPFYEPTRELVFANNLTNGNFSVLLIPGGDTEEQRWQIFTTDAVSGKVNSFNIRFDYSIVFDTSDSQRVVDEFLQKQEADTSLITDIQASIVAGKSDNEIASELSIGLGYNDLDTNDKESLLDDLGEIVYTVRTGVDKDDFAPVSASEWPLIEYGEDGSSIISDYLDDEGLLLKEYAFDDELSPKFSPYTIPNGLSSCYYYQQETEADGKPMKNKACVMLAMGLAKGPEGENQNKYLGILNFAVADSGRLSRLTTDAVNIPDINVQALDENPYNTLEEIPTDDDDKVAWQAPQTMEILDIDPNGLSTSGGVLKFAYTSAAIGGSQGYSDAVEATAPLLFDDSLGRVNLYFKGTNDNFFVLYFNPTGSKSIKIADSDSLPASPPLSLQPRLDRDMEIKVEANEVSSNSNTCQLSMISLMKNEEVETWAYLPRRLSQIAGILNGNSELPLGILEPLGNTDDPRAAYLKPSTGNGILKLRTTVDNNLLFQSPDAYAAEIVDGNTYQQSLDELSSYLSNNKILRIANKTFSLVGDVDLKADVFYKSYLSGIVTNVNDIDKLWSYLKGQAEDKEGLLIVIPEILINEVTSEQGTLTLASMEGTTTSLSAVLADSNIDRLSLELLQEGSDSDKKSERARLKQSLIALILDVAKMRIVSFELLDTNSESVNRLEAGLAVSVVYDYSNFTCKPEHLDGTSAARWEHARSYLFNAGVNHKEAEVDQKGDILVEAVTPGSEIKDSFNYTYEIKNTIGQWEDWEASLALEMSLGSVTNGAVLYTIDSNKLDALQPTEKGLSVEAWVKPSQGLNDTGHILYYKKDDKHYALGIEKDSDNDSKFKCVATLGSHKYISEEAFAFQEAGRDQWRHLAFTHKKYWGYQLADGNTINCGNDSSLQLSDEFTLEILVKIDTVGTLLEKEEEYCLSINSNKEVVFDWAGGNCLSEWVKMDDNFVPNSGYDTEKYKKIGDDWYENNKPDSLDELNQFYKITLIRSKDKPQTEPTQAEYPITGGDQGADAQNKWYTDKTDTNDLLQGMAEKQDQQERNMKFAQMNMLVSTDDESSEATPPTYYHTLIITKSDNHSTEWTTSSAKKVERAEKYNNVIMGGEAFTGIFDSVRIWNRALSTSDAKALPVPENTAGLLSHWRMAEGKGQYLYDNVSENHGVADGGTWEYSPQSNQPGQFQFYVDGSRVAHLEPPTDFTAQGMDQFSIGGVKKNDDSFEKHYQGILEEIRIWNVPRTHEQITDNAFGRLKGEWEQLLANYTFDKPINQTDDNKVQDSSMNSVQLMIHNRDMVKEVLSTAPIATEIPQVRSALAGVLTDYNGTIKSRPGVVEYGDVQKNEDGTLNGILKRCYSFIDKDGAWNLMTGYKVGNLISQWYSQAQFAPQVMGYLEGPPPVPSENFPIGSDADPRTYAYVLNNSIGFKQAEEVSFNYNTSKEAGWKVGVESEGDTGVEIDTLIAPFGFGFSFGAETTLAAKSNWETSGKRSHSYERGTSVNTERALSAALAGYGKFGVDPFYKLGNTGYALVKSKTADIYLLRLAHNNALVSISWQPNPDIPEDVNIVPFPINPLYIKQGTLDGKLGDDTDNHYPQAQGTYGQYSYFKPREAYELKKQIEREKMELKAYFEDSFDVAKTNAHFQAAAASTGVAQLASLYPVTGPLLTSGFNKVFGQLATQVGYNNTRLKEELAKMGSQRNLANTYVWTIEGGFFAESTEVAETQQETFANQTDLSLGGGLGATTAAKAGVSLEQKSMFSSGSSLTLTKTKTRESKSSFGLEVSVDIPTSPRYQYAGTDGRSLIKGLINPGTVDAYRFMSFYLEPKAKNFTDLFSKVIDPIWLDESPDPNAQALRQAAGNKEKAKPCWRIMHRVTYVSRILPEFQPEAPPSLEKSLRVAGVESNYMLIKKFEPYLAHLSDSGDFCDKIDDLIATQLPEFTAYKQQIKYYLALYFNIDQV